MTQTILIVDDEPKIVQICRDYLTAAGFEVISLALECQAVNLGEIAESTANLFEAEAADKGIVLTVQVEPDLPTVTADPQRVGQVIGNLLSNALRYAPASTGQVMLTVQPVEQGVTLSVSDNGPGIPAADLPHLFDRFWRGEKSRTRSARGAGLGLAIAKQLVEMHGGRIGVESTPGGGSKFWFMLPLNSIPIGSNDWSA
jgi:signal transduction histidine kinase